MRIKIIKSYKNAHLAEGLVIVVDVLRAFTTSCFIFNNGAEKIIPIADIEKAKLLAHKNPKFILMGERKGLKPDGFDYGNSPAEIDGVNMKGKTVILTTSAGTKGIGKAVNADTIITGAFVNSKAIIDYVKEQRPEIVTFIATNDNHDDNEDFMFIEYVRNCLKDNSLDFKDIKNKLINHPTAYGFLKKPITVFSRMDFHLSIDLDRFDFIIKATRDKDRTELVKIRI